MSTTLVRACSIVLCAAATLTGAARDAAAFCGFYVAGADTSLFNDATVVTLLRDGTTTVLSMRNDYAGPPERFAMVVPVEVVLRKDDVKTLPREVFEHIDQLAAPRLVEYWEQDPCSLLGTSQYGTLGFGSGTGSGFGVGSGRGGGGFVRVEAEFTVGEYEIVVLSSNDAVTLESWITEHGYAIPAGAAPYLRPYIEGGFKFFVARVDPKKVTFKDGRARLSPLRFHYESPELRLPVRLGLINSRGTQDLIVHILARGQRYEAANYPNVTIPTNLLVKDDVRDRFGEMYAALFDATAERNPRAVITEYAWDSGTCDPCPGEPLSLAELTTLGLDVVDKGAGGPPSATVTVADLRIDRPIVTGDLDVEVVRRYLRRNKPRLTYCYEKQVLVKPTLAGKVDLEFTIDANGKVRAATATGLGDATVEACIVDTVRRLELPRPGTPTVKVKQGLVFGQTTRPRAWSGGASGWVLTRLHLRYDKDSLGEDLVFKVAPPIQGGRGGGGDDLVKDAQPAGNNQFQGRYIIRHPWAGAIACDAPLRGMWGGRPEGGGGGADAKVAVDVAFAPRGKTPLPMMISEPVLALGLQPGVVAAPPTRPAPASDASPAPGTPPSPPVTAPEPTRNQGGCACDLSAGDEAPAGSLLAIGLGLVGLVTGRRSSLNLAGLRRRRVPS